MTLHHPSTQQPATELAPITHVDVSVRISYPLLRDVTRRWPGQTLDEKVANALMLACAWHDHGDDDEDPAA